jgi:hypothetical protein
MCLLALGLLLSSITSGVILTSNNLKTNSNINIIASKKGNYNNSRVTVLAFDDAWKTQFIYAKPILDRFGFKGSFFIVCNYIGKNPDRLTWTDVQALESQGHDIESHTMNHIPVDDLSQQQLDYEIGQSKQCIIDHGIITNNSENGNNNNVQIFAYPYDIGHSNITVIDTVTKYYELGRTGDKPLAFLNCNLSLEDKRNGSIAQTDYYNGSCSHNFAKTGNNIKKNNFTADNHDNNIIDDNRYSIRSWTHHVHDKYGSYNDSQMLDQFIQEANSQNRYNSDGVTNAIPIITYHNFTPSTTSNMIYTRNDYNTDVNLFYKEMKYLHDNNFTVLPMACLAFNNNTDSLYLKCPRGK